MQQHRTTKCAAAGHREFTIQFAQKSPIPGAQDILLSYFEGAVGRGTKFLPGQTVQVGWSVLKLCERTDGTIGVQERELTPDVTWTESVDRAVSDVWLQKEVCASVGQELTFPRQDEDALVAECAMESDAIVMTRIAGEDMPEGFSGWMLSCAHEHDHGERRQLPLLAIAAMNPSLVQMLALPHDTIVLALWKEKANAPAGMLRIEPHVFRDGKEIVPRDGSYLAALQA
jgi:hypothetical protein